LKRTPRLGAAAAARIASVDDAGWVFDVRIVTTFDELHNAR
jgi:hypothetical protein